MYRHGNEYDEIEETVASIYIDYDIHTFPIDECEVCKKLGAVLMPYSLYDRNKIWLLMKRSNLGFFVKRSIEQPPTIYYNDRIQSEGSRRFTIFHELKHFVYNDDDESEDDLADHFSRFFMCPTPYLMLKGIEKPNEIVSFCNVSFAAARNVSQTIINRKRKYGTKLFEHEIPLLKHLAPELLKANGYDVNREGGEIYDCF